MNFDVSPKSAIAVLSSDPRGTYISGHDKIPSPLFLWITIKLIDLKEVTCIQRSYQRS